MDLIKVDDEFLIQATIARAENVYGFAMSLNFPADALEVLHNDDKPIVVKGDFLGEEADIFPNLSINTTNNTGTLIIGYSQKGSAPEKSGEGLMFSIKAKALKEGEHALVWSANSTVKNSSMEDQLCSFDDFMLKLEKNMPEKNVVSISVVKVVTE